MIKTFLILVMLGAALSACGQDEVQFPDDSCGGSGCGEYYPDGARDSDDTATDPVSLGLNEGDIIPCLVFPSVRKDDYALPTETHLNLGETYLQYYFEETAPLNRFFGLDEDAGVPRYLVFVGAAAHCPECASLIADLSESAAEIEAAGILSTAVANKDLWRTEYGLSLEESEEVLELDGWPTRWLRTHDPSDQVTSIMAAWPTVIGVRLPDMRILINDASVRTAEDLISVLQSRDAASEVAED